MTARTARALACALAATILGAAVSGHAEDEPAVSAAAAVNPDEGWAFDFAPYIWALSLEGEIEAKGTTADVDVPFKDILDMLNMGLFGKFEARKGRFFGLIDVNASWLSDENKSDTRTVGFGPASFSQGPVTVNVPRVQATVGPAEVDVDTTMVLVKFAGGYRIVSRALGETPDDPRRFTFDAYAGGRYWYLKNEIDVEIPPVKIPGFNVSASAMGPLGRTIDLGNVRLGGVNVGGINQTFKDTQQWVDPILGLRFRYDPAANWTLTVFGDVGGFGIGSAADFSWETAGLVAWHFGEAWSLIGGYRALGVDRNAIDLVMHGPVIGFAYRWGAARRPR